MIIRVNLPKWGMGIDEGTIVRWYKAEGDTVTRGEPLADVETAKATQEVEAPADGVISRILVAQGDTVPVNTTLAEIEG